MIMIVTMSGAAWSRVGLHGHELDCMNMRAIYERPEVMLTVRGVALRIRVWCFVAAEDYN